MIAMPRIFHHLIPRTVTLQPKPDPKPDQSLEIYTPKQGEDHPHLFDTGVPPPPAKGLQKSTY